MNDLSRLLQQIYDTALMPSRWPDTLTVVSTYIGASFMSVVPYNDPSLIFMSKGGETAMQGYTEHWYKLDAMVEIGVSNKQYKGLLCDWSSIGHDAIERNPYYQEFRKDVGIGFCIGSTFEAYPGDFRGLGINLPLGVGPLDSNRLEQIDDILRHLARAITISSRTACLTSLPGFAETLERIQCGAAVIDVIGRVIIANQAFVNFGADGIDFSSGRIRCARPPCQKGLDHLLASTIAKDASKYGIDFALIQRPSGKMPFMARAVPLSNQSTEAIWGKPAPIRQALLLVVDLAAEADASSEIAFRKVGLTAAESKVAALIGGGLSPRQVAEHLRHTEGTVRTTLKQVFSKMSLSRQSDLVRLAGQISKLS